MATNGSDVLLYVETESDTFTAVAKQTGLSRSRSTNTIDVSHKLSENDEFIPGRANSTLSLNALWVPTHAAYTYLEQAQEDKELVIVRITNDGEHWREADALITQMDEDWPDNAASTINASLQVSGAWRDVEESSS